MGGAVIGIATALGPVLGGVITTEWNWRGIFLVNVPIGAGALAATLGRVEESRSSVTPGGPTGPACWPVHRRAGQPYCEHPG